MSSVDYYAVLGVAQDADTAAIKRAYRRLALECHPDRFPGDPAAAQRFRDVSRAYEILGDPQKRAQYDRGSFAEELSNLAAKPSVSSAQELFRSVFGDVFGNRKRESRRGRDIRYTLSLSLREAALGCQRSIELEALASCEHCDGRGFEPGGQPPKVCELCSGTGEVKRGGLLSRRSRCGRCNGTGMIQIDPCRKCHGRGSVRKVREFNVRIPPGTQAGSERCIEGQGEPGRYGGKPGHLRITINVSPDPFLSRQGRDILCQVPVSPFQLALGDEILVPTIEGKARLRVPAGIDDGTRLRMRGLGIADGKGARGDQIVVLRAETLVALSAEQKQLLSSITELLGPDNLPKCAALKRSMAQKADEVDEPDLQDSAL